MIPIKKPKLEFLPSYKVTSLGIFCLCTNEILLIDPQHLGQSLVSVIDIAGMHLIENKVFAYVTILSKLRLDLFKVQRQVLSWCLFLLLFFQHIGSLPFGGLYAALARFSAPQRFLARLQRGFLLSLLLFLVLFLTAVHIFATIGIHRLL